MANYLSLEKKVRIVRCLVDGVGVRATARIAGVSKPSVLKLLAQLGSACKQFHDTAVRNLQCQRIQCDEIWSFVGCKEIHLRPGMKKHGWGDAWTWTALCPDTKLLVAWRVGTREASDGELFMQDLYSRLLNRVQLTTDGHNGYLSAIGNTFGLDVDYAMTIKKFTRPEDEERVGARYSPTACTDIQKKVIAGNPDPDHISTSLNERNNLHTRMRIRRFTRLTNGFSKKRENHDHAVSLHFTYRNFCDIHGTLRCTPAQEAGVSKHVWDIEELLALTNAR